MAVKARPPHTLWHSGKWWIHHQGHLFQVGPASATEAGAIEPGTPIRDSGILTSPMPANVLALHCRVGDRVEAGELLAVLEAMKMEYHLHAPFSGRVAQIHCQPGNKVAMGALLLEVQA